MSLPVAPWTQKFYNPDSTDILSGLATVSGNTIITIPAGRTWFGVAMISGAITVAAAASGVTGSVRVSTAGTGVIPAAGDLIRVELIAAGGVVGALTGSQAGQTVSSPSFYVSAPAGNSVTLVLNSTNTTSQSASCLGVLV